MPIDTTPTTPTTLLDAINTLLQGIRVAGITSLAQADLNEDAATAKKTIDDVIREALTPGFEFNTEREVVLDPSPSGEIALPSNTLRVVTTRWSSGNRLARRGARLYDPIKRTYSIGQSVKVDLTVALEFGDLPPVARTYVTALSARRFCIPRMPEGTTFKYTEEMVQSALLAMQQEDTDVADTDLTMTSPHFAKMKRR